MYHMVVQEVGVVGLAVHDRTGHADCTESFAAFSWLATHEIDRALLATAQ